MNVLVTGGTGFIGNALVKELLLRKNEVIVASMRSNSPQNQPVKIRTSNLKNLEDCVKATKDMDAIFHLATAGEKGKTQEEIQSENETMMKNLLESAKKNQVKSFLLASTLLVNSFLENPKQETSRRGYIQSKLNQEKMLVQTATQAGFSFCIVRIGNCYGPGFLSSGQPSVIGTFITKAIENQPIPVFGEGNQKRSFIHVDDVAKGMCAVFESNKANEPLDLTFPETITINDLAKKIISLTNSKSEISRIPQDHVDVSRPIFDMEKTRLKTGFVPQFSLEKGLKDTISWYQKNKGK
ncbi:MAG: NAD(P)-dependent oxidoreductase [Candidatus Diapherotrites archaeon]|uniref:NAD(P)-dependent oxidoreductase n=1 Tax=Candidatus Iainarchaeum sp. TaxID=3101447 RepID=A0A8T4LES4_9ARCH|nr:NAD(P)-dependent oxidoreductase [Candidatus Diapherotrites archaeon]